jgi:AraC-like DNA-binding protein
MAENVDRKVTVEMLAGRAAMSPCNFARVFAREMGTTPSRYLLQLRVEGARRLLEQTDKAPAQVSFACGFSSTDLIPRALSSVSRMRYTRLRETTWGECLAGTPAIDRCYRNNTNKLLDIHLQIGRSFCSYGCFFDAT